jgi:hypothetical protein
VDTPLENSAERVADDGEKLPHLNDPFGWGPKGELVWQSEDKSGDPIVYIICHQPLYLQEVQRSEVGREKYSYLFRHFLKHEGWRAVTLDAENVFAHNARGTLARNGILIRDMTLFHKYMDETVKTFHDDSRTGIRYDQFGWKSNFTQFFLGRSLYTMAGKITVQGSNEVENRAPHFGPRSPTASLVVWTEAADMLFGKSSLPLGVCVLASFAAPLMSLLLTVDGGCIVHLYSGASGAGKSWAMDCGWSVWGEKRAMMLVNDDTKVSKPIVMGTLCHLPICYDEIYNKDPETTRQFVELFTSGRDRMRGAPDGTTRQVATTWRTIMTSNSNHDMLEGLDTSGVDALGFRVLQLFCEALEDFDKEMAARLKRRLEDNCGIAGDVYIKYLINPDVLASVRKMLDQFHADIWKETGLSPAHRYRVAAVACILVAAVITRHLDILHFDIDRIRQYLLKELTDPTNAGVVTGVTTAESAMSRMADFLNAFQGEILTVPNKFMPGNKTPMVPLGNVPRGRISGRYEIATRRLYIAYTPFREWCLRNQVSAREIVGHLRKINLVLETQHRITLTGGTSIPGVQGVTITMDADHPALSGMMRAIDREVTGEKKA